MLSVNNLIRNLFVCVISLSVIMLGLKTAWAETENNTSIAKEEKPDVIPDLYGIGTTFGSTYDPVTNINFLQFNAFALYDYEKVWRHAAPEPLRFKVECNLGLTTSNPYRAICSVNMLALYYLDNLSSQSLRPYIEGGIGIIYTDFQVKDQGLRINFNPQLGIGTEILIDSKPAFYVAIRAHHFSNGEIRHEENRGVNSVVLVVGRFF